MRRARQRNTLARAQTIWSAVHPIHRCKDARAVVFRRRCCRRCSCTRARWGCLCEGRGQRGPSRAERTVIVARPRRYESKIRSCHSRSHRCRRGVIWVSEYAIMTRGGVESVQRPERQCSGSGRRLKGVGRRRWRVLSRDVGRGGRYRRGCLVFFGHVFSSPMLHQLGRHADRWPFLPSGRGQRYHGRNLRWRRSLRVRWCR